MAAFDVNTTASEVATALKSQAVGKTFVVTGPSARSLGAVAAANLALGSPKRLILVGRSKEKIQPVIDEINKVDSSIVVDLVHADLTDNSSVRSAAVEIKKLTTEIHGLINNAGIMGLREFSKSEDGIETQFAANHIGHFLLTNLLMPEIKKGQGVVTNVTSRGYFLNNVYFDDPNFEDGKTYNGWRAYAQSKSANILFSVALAKRTRGLGVAAFSVNPGYVESTELQKNSDITPEWFMSAFELAPKNETEAHTKVIPVSIDQGAATMVWSVLDPTLRDASGSFLEHCRVEDLNDYATDPENAEKLWQLSERLLGDEFIVYEYNN